MNIQVFLKPQELSVADIEQFDGDFSIVLTEKEQVQKVYEYLHVFFRNDQFTAKTIDTYYHSYWKWYVKASWLLYDYLSFDEFKEMFCLQFATAIQLGINVSEKMLTYFMNNFSDDVMPQKFAELREEFITQSYPLRPGGKEEFTIARIIETYKRVMRGDSLESAQFFAGIEKQLFSDGYNLGALSESEQTEKISEFINLVMFVAEKKDIVRAVQAYYEGIMDPIEDITIDKELYKEGLKRYLIEQDEEDDKNNVLLNGLLEALFDEKGNERTTAEAVAILHGRHADENTLINNSEKNIATSDTTAPKEEQPAAAKRYDTIKQQIIDSFADEDGNIDNLEGVFDLLDMLANQYDDDDIRELYYYDEQAHGFVWNSTLLSNS